MLNKLFETVDQLGGNVTHARCSRGTDHVLVSLDGNEVEFVAVVRERAPYPAEVDQLELAHVNQHVPLWKAPVLPLLVTRYISRPLGAQLTIAGWSWMDSVGNCDLRAPGIRIHLNSSERPPRRPGKLPMGSGNLSIVRTILCTPSQDEWATADLAITTGNSQPVVIQTMRRLESLALCMHTRRGNWRVDTAALLERFSSDYPGPLGSERYFYCSTDLRTLASELSAHSRSQIAISADVGPDLLAPWRMPTTLIVYCKANVKPFRRNDLLSVTTMEAANILQIFPRDGSVFPRQTILRGYPGLGDVQLTDPIQMIWDLGRLGGEDRERAAHEMRQWLSNK